MKIFETILIIISILVIIIGAGWGYFLYTNRKGPVHPPNESPGISTLPSQSQPPITPTPILSPSPNKQLFQFVSQRWILNPSLQGNNIVFFDKIDGMFKTINQTLNTNQETKLNDSKFRDVQRVLWSPQKDKAVMEYIENQQTLHAVFDLQQNLSYNLPFYLTAFSWSPDGKQLAVYHNLPVKNEFYVGTINPDGSGEKKLASVRINNADLAWTATNTIAFWEKPSQNRIIERIFTYDTKAKVLSDIRLPLYEGNIKRIINIF